MQKEFMMPANAILLLFMLENCFYFYFRFSFAISMKRLRQKTFLALLSAELNLCFGYILMAFGDAFFMSCRHDACHIFVAHTEHTTTMLTSNAYIWH